MVITQLANPGTTNRQAHHLILQPSSPLSKSILIMPSTKLTPAAVCDAELCLLWNASRNSFWMTAVSLASPPQFRILLFQTHLDPRNGRCGQTSRARNTQSIFLLRESRLCTTLPHRRKTKSPVPHPKKNSDGCCLLLRGGIGVRRAQADVPTTIYRLLDYLYGNSCISETTRWSLHTSLGRFTTSLLYYDFDIFEK